MSVVAASTTTYGGVFRQFHHTGQLISTGKRKKNNFKCASKLKPGLSLHWGTTFFLMKSHEIS